LEKTKKGITQDTRRRKNKDRTYNTENWNRWV